MAIRPGTKRREAQALATARERIQHVVVLMLENRSFDHLLGFLEHPKSGGEFERLTPGSHPNPLDVKRRGSQPTGVSNDARHILQRDPPHSHFAAKQQMNGRGGWKRFRMNGFVTAYGLKVAGREHLPYVHWLRIYVALVAVGALIAAAVGDVLLLRRGWLIFAALFLPAIALLAWIAGRANVILQRPRWELWGAVVALALVIAGGVQGGVHRVRSGAGHYWWFWAVTVVIVEVVAQIMRVRFNRKIHQAVRPDEVAVASERIMRCMSPEEQLPVLAKLAKEFAVCTRWHSSVPGATWPNRNFVHAATSDQSVDIEIGFYESKTIFEVLDDAGAANGQAPWQVYHDGMAQLCAFPHLWAGDAIARWFPIDALAGHAHDGMLPRYAFIEPRHSGGHTNSQHPGNNETASDDTTDFRRGEVLIKQVYDALKGVLDTTLLIITYDEHGGFFDHVPPRRVRRPTPIRSERGRSPVGIVRRVVAFFVQNKNAPFDFRHVGVRVPAVAVSAWIAPGTVDATPYDHTSVIATVRELFAPRASALTQRDRSARALHHLVVTSTARTELPDLPDPPPDDGRLAQPAPDQPTPTTRRAASTPPPAPTPESPREPARRVDGPVKTTVANDLPEQLEALAPKVDAELDQRQAPARADLLEAVPAPGPASARTGDRFRQLAEQQRGAPQ